MTAAERSLGATARTARARGRRAFLRFLAASPALAQGGGLRGLEGVARDGAAPLDELEAVIASPRDALNVFDFEAAARRKLPPAHFGYLATGVDDDATLRANRDGFARYQIRPRRLVDVTTADLSVDLFGATWKTPIVLAPAASQQAFHPEGELASARGARRGGHLQILSTGSNASIEEVAAARGERFWFQLYPATDWKVTSALIRRAEAAGCPVLVLTVDQVAGMNRETLARLQRRDPRPCAACHDRTSLKTASVRRRIFDGLDLAGISLNPPDLTWDFVARLKDATRMKLVIKGLVTREDAELAVLRGADGIICSNHGGRGDETGRPSIESLREVLEGAAGRVPVLVDSGFRRGTDIFKALALGARAVCVGRPYLWGLAAFGQEGVEAALEILTRELTMVMRQAGATTLKAISPAHVVRAAP